KRRAWSPAGPSGRAGRAPGPRSEPTGDAPQRGRHRLATPGASGHDDSPQDSSPDPRSTPMSAASFRRTLAGTRWLMAMAAPMVLGMAGVPSDCPKAFLDGTGPGWRALGAEDFVNVNCDPGTWTWKHGAVHCTGQPVGVLRTKKPLTNFELVAQWRHHRSGGNSGIFVW